MFKKITSVWYDKIYGALGSGEGGQDGWHGLAWADWLA